MHHVITYGHEGARCPTSLTVDGRRLWSAEFDKADRVTKLDLADAGTYWFSYFVDSSGAVTRVDIEDPGNNVLRITYCGSRRYLADHIASGDGSFDD